MFRRVFLLNGLAIVAVVFNHATIWGMTAMFWWADRYRPVTVPNFDLDATLPYYALLLLRKLAVFGVPAFLFFSGFFLNYAASGKSSGLSWKTVRVRVQALLIPYAIWFTVWLVREFLADQVYTPGQVATRLFLGWPVGAYWYIPIITAFYLLSPFLVRLARARPYQLLLGAAVLHLIEMGFSYSKLGWELLNAGAPGVVPTVYAGFPLHAHLILYFVFGLVVGVCRQDFERLLKGRAWYLLLAVLVLGALAVIESEVVYRATSLDWRSSTGTLPTSLYALAVILFFLAVQDIPKGMVKVGHNLATRMFGIYLVHSIILEVAARATQKYVPGLLAYVVPFQFVIVSLAVVGSILVMEAVARSPLRKYSKYLFG